MNINAYYNGLFTSKENIKIPLTDRSIFFGDGIYDAAIGRKGKIFMLKEHLSRFYLNASLMKLHCPLDKTRLEETLLKLAAFADKECFFIYFQLSRYSNERRHSYPANQPGNLLITTSKIDLPDKRKKLKLITKKDIR